MLFATEANVDDETYNPLPSEPEGVNVDEMVELFMFVSVVVSEYIAVEKLLMLQFFIVVFENLV